MDQPYIPYFQTTRYRVEAMLALSQLKKDETGVDLGSGDGRIVIEFAKKGIEMTGYELNGMLVEQSQTLIRQNRIINTHIVQKDFWHADLSSFDIITIYPMPDILGALEQKLLKETKIGARILINYYPLPTWKLNASKDHIFLYLKTVS